MIKLESDKKVTLRGESVEEGSAEEEEERLDRESFRGEELEPVVDFEEGGKHLVVFFGNDIRSEEAGEGRDLGEEGREERQVVEELGDELCKDDVSVNLEEYESFEGEP